jgi:sec-independent protein translocase protein TatB
MFGLGMGEIIVILVVALLFLGPEKLPDAAKQIGKTIRELRKHTETLKETIDQDEHLGGTVRELRSALRGDLEPAVRQMLKPTLPKPAEGAVAQGTAAAAMAAAEAPSPNPPADAPTVMPEPPPAAPAPEAAAAPEPPAAAPAPPAEAAAASAPASPAQPPTTEPPTTEPRHG